MNDILIGWLAPNGKFHKCGFMEHLEKAEELAEYYYNDKQLITGDEYLLLKGFAKFTRDHVFMCDSSIRFFAFTDKQIEFLNKLQLTERQKSNVSIILESEDLYSKAEIYKGDENLTPYSPSRIIHTMDEYPTPTKYIKITANVPVSKEFRPVIGNVYPVIKTKDGKRNDKLYFILVNGEEVGIYPYRECEVVGVSG